MEWPAGAWIVASLVQGEALEGFQNRSGKPLEGWGIPAYTVVFFTSALSWFTLGEHPAGNPWVGKIRSFEPVKRRNPPAAAQVREVITADTKTEICAGGMQIGAPSTEGVRVPVLPCGHQRSHLDMYLYMAAHVEDLPGRR